ncbi:MULTISPECIES: SulP family inorganic anion transporter [unclassified Microbacterium]|uniref:SulP family inorganic anion transporter n=1 Tax=unclassified Microbacterium TaxID=2609290 RepID=UPI0006F8565C|nr:MULTISPECIES: SulP family inorganic anion transporter [unclassified Microbacterium]KQP74273.1 sulfate transporter [Microbacterium sp. Leaf288]MDT0144368.1 SulP family inorganic anion transporter [Microbacterium sp. PRC9]
MGFDPRSWFSRKTLRKDAVAGVILGVEAVPDGLAAGLLAGVNPLAGLYGYLFGMVGAAVLTSSAFMAVQATSAMALVVSDAGLESLPDPDRGLFTLAILTGIIMVIAGLLRGGRLISFVPTPVMTGFVTAIGVNIILGQLSNFTGYQAEGANRLLKTIDVLVHIGQWNISSLVVGAIAVLIIVVLLPTRVGSMGLVIAVVVGSVCAVLLNLWVPNSVVLLRDIVDVPRGLPAPVLPSIADAPNLLIPALSLTFIGLVQGAAVSAGIPTADGRRADANRDFMGQGLGNVVSGLFQGMPVGGSMSGSSLIVQAGAKTRLSLFVAGAVMAVVIFALADVVAFVAMPALAGLLIVVGWRAIKPSRIYSVIKSGLLPTTIMAVTFGLTLIIPLQFAVLVGVGLGVILYVAEQSNSVRVRAVVIADDGRMRETDPPAVVPPGVVLVLQPYGSLFFASAPVFERQLPDVSRESSGSVVIVRLRGTDEIGLSHVEVLRRFAAELRDADSTLKVVATEDRVISQLDAGGLTADIGADNVYRGTEWVGEGLRRAYADARAEIED